jgi:hypothetical protein
MINCSSTSTGNRTSRCRRGRRGCMIGVDVLINNLGAASGVSKMISEPVVRLVQTVRLSCTDTYTISKGTETRFIGPMSPRSSIRCVQNEFRAYGTLAANRAPILHQN